MRLFLRCVTAMLFLAREGEAVVIGFKGQVVAGYFYVVKFVQFVYPCGQHGSEVICDERRLR